MKHALRHSDFGTIAIANREGEAPAEPNRVPASGSAGASPSPWRHASRQLPVTNHQSPVTPASHGRGGHATRLLLVAAAWLFATPSLAAPAQIWVAPDGDDAAAGTRESPLASPALALRRARELRRLHSPAVAEGVTITLRGGLYFLDEPLRIRPEDSGTGSSPTILQAAPGETPVLSGGELLSGWLPLRDEVQGLPESARDHVLAVSLPWVEGRQLEFRQLWVGDARATRARTPNAPDMHRTLAWDRATERCTIARDALGRLRDASLLEMTVLQAWEIAQLRIGAIEVDDDRLHVSFHDPESRLQFEHPWPPPTMDPRGAPFFLTGAIEFLDQPGEFYVDPVEQRAYCWPPADANPRARPAVAPRLETVVEITGTVDRPVRHVELRGLTFSHCAWHRPATHGHVPLQATMAMTEAYKLRPKGTPEWRSLDNQAWLVRTPAAVTVAGAQHVSFQRCRFQHTAAAGLDLVQGVHDARVEGCIFRDTGGNGLQTGSFQTGPVETHLAWLPRDERLICTRCTIANNVVTDCGAEDWGAVGIIVGYAREAAIQHNDISNCPYTGISLGWGWTRDANAMRDNRVVANRIRRVATRTSDTAGIYTLSNQPGTVVRGNAIDEIAMSPQVHDPSHWFYVYLDEGSSWITVEDNWCPAERFLANANGPGNVWRHNGPQAGDAVKEAAGLESEYRDLLEE
ncbi:MAG: hypothetical protein CMJ58_27905 [Planctomycetaceae bacterium]|nr:hypothetical protein [Planctomycetaceae bacterium]